MFHSVDAPALWLDSLRGRIDMVITRDGRRLVLGAAALSLTLTGCSFRSETGFTTELSAPLPHTAREERALVANLRAAYEACETSPLWPSERVQPKSPPPPCVRFRTDKVDTKQVANYVAAGLALSDFACDLFFRETNKNARHRKFSRHTVNDAGGVVTAILGAVKAGSIATGLAGTGFASLDGWMSHYDDAFLVSADLAKMRRLVLAAQDNAKATLAKAAPATFFDGESAIIRYAGLCSFLGMQDMLDNSIGKSTSDFQKDTAAKTENKTGGAPATPAPAPAPAMGGGAAAPGRGAGAGHASHKPRSSKRSSPAGTASSSAPRLHIETLPGSAELASPPPPPLFQPSGSR